MTLFNNWAAGRCPTYNPSPMALYLAEHGPGTLAYLTKPKPKPKP